MKSQLESQIFTQLLAASGVMLLIIQTGLIDGWTSPNMSRLTATNSPIPMTLSEASWLATYLKLGRFVSMILIPIFLDLAGSRRAILYTFVPASTGWILLTVAKSPIVLYIARFLGGMSYGLAYGCYAMFLGEVSIPVYRGTITSIAMIGWSLGTLVATAAETYLVEVASCSIYLVTCFMGILLFAWLPDSPYQLVKNKDLKKARESLAWYRGQNDTKAEMDEIVEFIEATSRVSFMEKLKQFRLPQIRNALIVVTLVFIWTQVCGIPNIIFYMQIILTNGKSFLIEPSDAVVYANIIQLLFAVVSINLSDKWGRRNLLMSAYAMIAAALFGLGLHFYLLANTQVDPPSIQILPLASMITLVVALSIGVTPVMGGLLGEMFPAGVKSTAATTVTFASAFTGFIAVLIYQPLIDAIGEFYVFWMYAVLMASVIPVLLLLLTETKGKSLQEIQNVLNKRSMPSV